MALELDDGIATLKVYDDPSEIVFGQISLGPYTATTADVRLVATFAPGTVTLTVSGSVTGTLVTTVSVPPIPDAAIGLLVYSGAPASFGVDASYFSRIAVQ